MPEVKARQTVDLSEEKQERAKELSKKVDSGEIDHPEDLVDSWKPFPRGEVEWIEEKDEQKMFVPVEKIVGTDELNITRLKPSRMIKALMRLALGDYWRKPDHPPHLMKVDGGYYVGSDGNHRSLSHKALGIEEMYASVTFYERVSDSRVKEIMNGDEELSHKMEVHFDQGDASE